MRCKVDFATHRCEVCGQLHVVHTIHCMQMTSEQWVCSYSGECLDDIVNTVETYADTQRSTPVLLKRDAEIESDKRIKRIRSATIVTIKSVLCRITHTPPSIIIALLNSRPAHALNMTHYTPDIIQSVITTIHDILFQLEHNEITPHEWIDLILCHILSESAAADTRYSQNTDAVRRCVEDLLAKEVQRLAETHAPVPKSDLCCFLFIFHQNSVAKNLIYVNPRATQKEHKKWSKSV